MATGARLGGTLTTGASFVPRTLCGPFHQPRSHAFPSIRCQTSWPAAPGGSGLRSVFDRPFAAPTFNWPAFAPSAFARPAFAPSAFASTPFGPTAFAPSAVAPSAFAPTAFAPAVFPNRSRWQGARDFTGVHGVAHHGLTHSRLERAARELSSGQITRLIRAVRDWSDDAGQGVEAAWLSASMHGQPIDGARSTLHFGATWLPTFDEWLVAKQRRSTSRARRPRFWLERWRHECLAVFAAFAPSVIVAVLRRVARDRPHALMSLIASEGKRIGVRLERLVDTIVRHGPPLAATNELSVPQRWAESRMSG